LFHNDAISRQSFQNFAQDRRYKSILETFEIFRVETRANRRGHQQLVWSDDFHYSHYYQRLCALRITRDAAAHHAAHVPYGHSYKGGIQFAAWTAMDFVNVMIVLYPAIQINSKARMFTIAQTLHCYYLLYIGEITEATISNNDEHMFGERFSV
jgi:hypothetical protein